MEDVVFDVDGKCKSSMGELARGACVGGGGGAREVVEAVTEEAAGVGA